MLLQVRRGSFEPLRHSGVRWSIVAVCCGAIAYALIRSWGDLAGANLEFHPLPIVFAFACLLSVTFSAAALWVFTCRAMGGRIALRQGTRIVLLSNLAKYLPGKVMHAVGQVMLASERGVPPRIGVTSILVELAMSLMGACCVALFSLPTLIAQFRDQLLVVAVVLLPLGLAVLHPFVLRRVLLIAARVVPGARDQELPALAPYATILRLFAGYTLLWVVMAVAQFAVAQSIYPIDISHLPTMGGVVAVSYVFGLLVPFAPAGLGARDGVTIVLLSTFMPLPAAVAASVVYRVLGISADASAAAVAARL